MEQTKAKTADARSLAIKDVDYTKYSFGSGRTAYIDGFEKGFISSQSHIANLEAQNKELREALEKALDLTHDLTNAANYLDKQDEYYVLINMARVFYKEQALKEDKP